MGEEVCSMSKARLQPDPPYYASHRGFESSERCQQDTIAGHQSCTGKFTWGPCEWACFCWCHHAQRNGTTGKAGEDQIQCGVVITADQTDLPARRAWIEPDGTLVLLMERGSDRDTNPDS